VLCDLFLRAFECTHEIEYLNKAISAGRDNIKPANLAHESFALHGLIQSLLTRLRLLNRRDDLNELMQLFPMTAKYHGAEFLRLLHLHEWASVAHNFGHLSASTAYDCAMSSMQAFLTFIPTLDMQHSQLVAMQLIPKTLPSRYAFYQIRAGQLKQAVETLERGRSLLWSEMRGQRTSISQIRSVDPHLANNFALVNRDLETLTLALSPKNDGNGRVIDIEVMDPFGGLVVRQRRLFDDREKLISQIPVLPGLDLPEATFLRHSPFSCTSWAGDHHQQLRVGF